jgi:deazaflavin-dependent oxidoreductase (nitroreductase family)
MPASSVSSSPASPSSSSPGPRSGPTTAMTAMTARPGAPAQLSLPGQAAAPEGPIDLSGMFLMHRGFRRDLDRFVAGAASTPATDRRTWKRMARRWALFGSILHKHHQAEDTGLWPLLHLRATSPTEHDVLDLMTAQHALIDPALATCVELFSTLGTEADESSRARLHTTLVEVRERLLEHLACEERDAMTMVQRLLTTGDWDRLNHEYFTPEYGPLDRLALIGWLCDGLSEEQMLRFPGAKRSQLPMARLLSRRFGNAEMRTFQRVLAPGTLTKSDQKLLRNLRTIAKVHRFLRRVSGGRWANRFRGMDLIMLTVNGRRSGKHYTTPLIALRDGESYIVAASSAGVDREPSWWLNLKADPRGQVHLAGRRTPVVATELDGAERQRWWSNLVESLADYETYQTAVSRRIAVVRLSPTE